MIAVLSVGNSSIYGASRTLAALAEQHQAPHFLSYIDRKGRPLIAIIVSSAIGLIAYTAVMSPAAENNVFNWLLALSGLSSIFTWLTICLCHIRFRSAWKLAGHTLDELPFRSQPGIIGSYIGFIFNSLVFVAQFWVGFAPQGYADMSARELVINFFMVYLAAPIILASYLIYKVWFGTKWVRLGEVDIKTGVKMDYAELLEVRRREAEQFQSWPWWKKGYAIFC
jgi:amino acid transporter